MAKLEFPIDKIMSVTDARNNFSKIVEEIEGDPEGKYLLTKGGTPSVVIINVDHLEKLIGEKPVRIEKKVEKSEPPQPPETSVETPSQTPVAETPPTQPVQTNQPSPPSPQQPPANRSDEHTLPYTTPTRPEDPSK